MSYPAASEPLILVVDLETSGLEPHKHSILQIGAVWLSGPRTGEEFAMDCRVWAGAEIDPEALAVNGLSEERCRYAGLPSEFEAMCTFMLWVNVAPVMLAGNNPSFDRQFLHAALNRGQAMYAKFPHRVLDMHSLAVSYALAQGVPVPDKGFYTDAIYELLELGPEPEPHVAITGARKEVEALRFLLEWAASAGSPVPYEVVEDAPGS